MTKSGLKKFCNKICDLGEVTVHFKKSGFIHA